MNLITTVWPGRPYPRGATWDGEGVNFALFSEHAEKVELCIFDERGRRELQRIVLPEQTHQNFITAHDGYTLADLVSYNDKHNEANGEDNRDGHDNNLSWNSGAEGETDDAQVNALRAQRKLNFIATLLLSQGVPMVSAGDEIGRTQRGNNNAYCQDNEISWVDWNLTPDRTRLLEFTRRMIALRRAHPVFRRRDFFQGRPIHGGSVKDIVWFKPNGTEMNDEEWNQHFARSLGVLLAGQGLTETDQRGRPVTDLDFLLLFNAHHEEIAFSLPNHAAARRWLVVIDTTHEDGLAHDGTFDGGSPYPLKGRSLALLRQQKLPG